MPALYANYSSTVMTVSTLTGLLMNLYLAYRPMNYGQRVVLGQIITALSFCMLATVGEIVVGKLWLASVVASVFISSIGTALVQNGAMAITQRIPGGTHALAMMTGQSIAGVVPPLVAMLGSGLSISALSLGSFLSVSLLCGASVVLFQAKSNREYIKLAEEETTSEVPGLAQLWSLLKRLRVPCFVIVMVFVVSLNYPLFANNVNSRTVSPQIFSPLTHLVWNTGDLLGRVICQTPRFRTSRARTLVGLALARVAIVAVLIVLARTGNPSDVLFLAIMLVYGLSSGYTMSCAISFAPTCVPHNLQPAAGGVLGFIIAVGLLLGSAASFALVPIL